MQTHYWIVVLLLYYNYYYTTTQTGDCDKTIVDKRRHFIILLETRP